MSKLLTDNTLAEPNPFTPFFDDSRSGFASAAHVLDSRVWFEEGKGQALELRFACRQQAVEYLCFCMGTGYLLFKQIDVIRGRSVFSAIQMSEDPPQGLGESVGWLDAGGPLPRAPEAAKESKGPNDRTWMPTQAWVGAVANIGLGEPLKKWAAICSSPDGFESAVKLSKMPDGVYEVQFCQPESEAGLVNFLKDSGPVAYDPWRNTHEALLLTQAGIEVVAFRCTIANMTKPMQVARALVCAGGLRHDDDPILTQHVLQVIDRCRVNPSLARTHYPRRLQGQRIDGALALIMAMGLALGESRQHGGTA